VSTVIFSITVHQVNFVLMPLHLVCLLFDIPSNQLAGKVHALAISIVRFDL